MVCVTANAMKPSAIRLIAMMDRRAPDAGAIHMQLTKLKAATAAQTSACHQRSLNVSSNSARVNSQNTTTLPVDSAKQRRCEHQQQRNRGAAQRDVEGKKRHQFWLLLVSRRVTHNSTAWPSN